MKPQPNSTAWALWVPAVLRQQDTQRQQDWWYKNDGEGVLVHVVARYTQPPPLRFMRE